MKTLLAVAFLALIATTAAPAQTDAGIDMFYSSLGTQGEWISMEGGTYAWRPSGVESDWRPYSDGHWVWTDDGWYWASDEPWAWATYHYGRWYNDDYYGWVWVPGYEWAPAWVEWRYGGDFIGWAPLSPYAVFSPGWGVHYRRYWATPASYWSFVDCRYMGFRDMHRYLYRPTENMRFIGRTRTAGSVRYDNGRIITRGPEREFVEQRGNIRIPRTEMVDVRERGQSGMTRNNGSERIQVYRPRIDGTSRVTPGTRPDRVRVDDHTMGLDPRGTDIRRFDDARQPRESTVVPRPDVRRSDEGRQRETVVPTPDVRRNNDGRQRETVVPRPDVRRYDQGRPAPAVVRPSAPNTVRERPVRPPDRPADVRPAPSRPERRNPETVNVPRGGNWSPPQRGAAPAGRTERSGGERSGGDRSGGGRGGRR